eukprot:gene38870-47281_t
MYAVSIPFCYFTAGDPRKAAMIQAQKIADEKWNADYLQSQNDTISSADASFQFDVVSPLSSSLSSPMQLNPMTDEFSHDGLSDQDKSASKSAPSSNWLASWLGPSKEQKRAKAEFEKWQKDLKERSGEPVSLPPEYLPSAWACLAMFATLSCHALFFLMCHWVVAFKAATLFKPASKVEEGCFVLIKPPANRGSPALVMVQKGANQQLFVDFQRQKYLFTPSARLGEGAKKYPNGIFTLTAYPIALPLSQYLQTTGISGDAEVLKLTERWGKNHLAVALPSFVELLQTQLLSPLAIFQVFCALLWLLDEYWTYTLFSLGSVVMYEATTVFQRTRTQQMLGGMAPKPTPIYAYRGKKWSIITSKDLLPGDIISLAFKKRGGRGIGVGVPGTQVATAGNSSADKDKEQKDKDPNEGSVTTRNDLIPCDCLLLRGSAIVNEASLTGESVPQMKEALSALEANDQEGD